MFGKLLSKKHPDIEKILIPEDKIRQKVKELAERIRNDYRDRLPVLVSVLKGSFIFLSDLVRCLEIPCNVDFIGLSSYGGATDSTGVVRLIMDLKDTINARDVIVVEDIVDTGLTMDYLKRNLLTRNPKSLRICSLLDKKEARRIEVDIDYCGFSVPSEYLVGYGLDFNELYRNLPYVGVLKREACRKK